MSEREQLLRAAGIEEREVVGVQKWFDEGRGFGFIAPLDGSGDVMVHATALRRAGCTDVPDGATVTCRAIKRPRGWIVSKIVDVDTSTRYMPVADYPGPWHHGMVKFFHRTRGFGFIVSLDFDGDAFVHMETVREAGLAGLAPGMDVEFKIDLEADDLRVAQVREVAPC